MRCKGAKSFVDDLGQSRGVVLSRAVHFCDLLRPSPTTRRFVRFGRTRLPAVDLCLFFLKVQLCGWNAFFNVFTVRVDSDECQQREKRYRQARVIPTSAGERLRGIRCYSSQCQSYACYWRNKVTSRNKSLMRETRDRPTGHLPRSYYVPMSPKEVVGL